MIFHTKKEGALKEQPVVIPSDGQSEQSMEALEDFMNLVLVTCERINVHVTHGIAYISNPLNRTMPKGL